MIELRPYQSKLEADIRQAYMNGAKSVVAVLPCGGGKTYTFSSVAHKAAEKGKSAWAVAHRHNLVKQISMSFSRFGIDHGIVKSGYTPDYRNGIQVCSIQSLVNRSDKLAPPDLIIFDECHHCPSAQYKKIIKK
jgi:superfamily II DNA or RNA helicase